MSDTKQPWPSKESLVLMTTTERKTMEAYVEAHAYGISMRDRLREAYRAGWVARGESEKKKTPESMDSQGK